MPILDGKIRCGTCQEWKLLLSFQPSVVKAGCGQCKVCKRVAARKWEQDHPEHHKQTVRAYVKKRMANGHSAAQKRWRDKNPEKVKGHNLRRYGIGIDAYRLLLEKQGRGCKLCGAKHAGGKALYVDHCHLTGRIRGLLCRKCNTGIGLLGDNAASLEKALNYLREGEKL